MIIRQLAHCEPQCVEAARCVICAYALSKISTEEVRDACRCAAAGTPGQASRPA